MSRGDGTLFFRCRVLTQALMRISSQVLLHQSVGRITAVTAAATDLRQQADRRNCLLALVLLPQPESSSWHESEPTCRAV